MDLSDEKYILIYMFLLRVIEALRRSRVSYALAGGYAVALHGAVRGTVDVDLLIRHTEGVFVRAEKALLTLGLQPRLPVTAREVFRFREEYVRNRNLLAWSFVHPGRPSELVDILLTEDLGRVKVKKVRSQGRTIRIVSLEDLIRMKSATGRPQDIEDVKALRRLR
jgi:hypothetical protein